VAALVLLPPVVTDEAVASCEGWKTLSSLHMFTLMTTVCRVFIHTGVKFIDSLTVDLIIDTKYQSKVRNILTNIKSCLLSTVSWDMHQTLNVFHVCH